jgi:L-fucose isomerase-like protein
MYPVQSSICSAKPQGIFICNAGNRNRRKRYSLYERLRNGTFARRITQLILWNYYGTKMLCAAQDSNPVAPVLLGAAPPAEYFVCFGKMGALEQGSSASLTQIKDEARRILLSGL